MGGEHEDTVGVVNGDRIEGGFFVDDRSIDGTEVVCHTASISNGGRCVNRCGGRTDSKGGL